MSSRPVSPPPIARWPFFAGAFILVFAAGYFLITSGRPPTVPGLIATMLCLGGSIILCVIPTILENDKRLRLAEAAARDTADVQLRRLAQTADQLAHAVSRSQSTEEQAGRALGTLEEVAERLVAQAEELAAALQRTGEREQASHSDEIQRLTDERDQKLTALEIRLNTTSLALSETQAAVKKASASTHRAVDSLTARFDELSEQIREALATRQPVTPVAAATPPSPPAAEPDPAEASPQRFEAEHPTIELPAEPAPPASASPAAESTPAPAAEETIHSPPPGAIADTASAATETPPARAARKIRHHHPAEEHPGVAVEPGEPPAAPAAPLELALEGMPEPRPVMRLNRREPPGSTSLVATAYIGIGNKLFLRGDGPGLSWETGVPMQFLAIGKWGWTTTEATAPVTCRVYRNDETPMTEENAVIDPGTKTEITPRF